MEESATISSLTAALEHYLAAANREFLFPIPLEKNTIKGALNTELSSDADGITLVVRRPPNGFGEPEYFEPQLQILEEQLAKCGVALERIEPEAAPKKSRLKEFFSLKAEPTNDLVAFEVRCDDEPKAIASLETEVQEIQRNAEQKKVEETLASIESAIPKDMSPEMWASLVNGLGNLAEKLAAEHRVPAPKIDKADGVGHEMRTAKAREAVWLD